MRTIQEKYNAILEGTFSKSQFVKDAKRELSQFISPFNGYKDTVSILKSKGVIYEAKKKDTPEYDTPGKKYSDEALRRGVDYELEGMGLMSQESILEKDFIKAEKKAIKNLDKDPNHYLHLLSGDSKKVDKHDKYVEVKKNNHVDTFNGLKKAELKEAAMAKGFTEEQIEAALKSLKEKKKSLYEYDQADAVADYIKDFYKNPKTGESIIDDETINDFYRTHPEWEEQADGSDEGMQAVLDNFKEFLSVNTDYIDEKKGKDHDGDGDVDGDDYMAAKDKAIKKAMGKDVDEDIHDKDILSRPISNPAVGDYKMSPEMAKDHNDDRSYSAITSKYRKQINDPSISDEELEYILGGSGNPRMGGTPDAIKRVIQDRNKSSISEGRRRKMKGGKVVTENDYETGGYVESMGPMLEKAMKQLESVWEEWKAGPATEAAMVPHAKKDLVSYLESRINIGEDIVEDAIEEHEEIKEAFKAIISKVLQEEVITEAATGNLSKIASQYSDFEGFQNAINGLENIVTDVESYYAKTKDKIQKVYDSFKDIKNTEGLAIGAMLGPAIESAFRKDLMPVTEKGFTKGLEMPKVKMLETDEIAEEELEEKETVFTPINEALNKELIKFGPDLLKRLNTAGFKTGLFKGQGMVPVDAQKKIQSDPSLAGIAYKQYPDGYEFLEVSVNKSKADALEKVAKYFSTPEGQYGPDKDAGWVVKNARNVNPGDIYRSKLGGMNGLATITYFRAEEAGSKFGTDKIKSTDKIAAEGKKYKYSKRK